MTNEKGKVIDIFSFNKGKKERLERLAQKYHEWVYTDIIEFIEVHDCSPLGILDDELKHFRYHCYEESREYFIYFRDLLTYWIEDLEHWDWGEEDEK